MLQRLRTPLLLLLIAVASAFAQEASRPPHPLTDLPPAGDVATAFYFPEHPKLKFPAGDEIKVVLGLRNTGVASLNVSSIMGSLNSPSDFRIYLQNFTQRIYFAEVAAGQEVSLEYRFQPDALIPAPREFVIALTAFYGPGEAAAAHSATFFNATVEIVEQPRLVDTEALFMWAILAALAAGVGYAAYGYLRSHLPQLSKSGAKKKAAARTKAEAAPVAIDHDDWVKGTAYDQMMKKRKVAGGSKKDRAPAAAKQ